MSGRTAVIASQSTFHGRQLCARRSGCSTSKLLAIGNLMPYGAFGSLILLDEILDAAGPTEACGAQSARMVVSTLRRWRIDPDVVVTSVQGTNSIALHTLLGELRRLPFEVVCTSALDSSVVEPHPSPLGVFSRGVGRRFSQIRAPSVSTLFEVSIVPMLMERLAVLVMADRDNLESIRVELRARGCAQPGRPRKATLLDLYRFDQKFTAVPVPLHIDWIGSPARRRGYL